MKYRIGEIIFLLCGFCVLTAAITACLLASVNYHESADKLIRFDENTINTAYLRINDVYGTENQKSLSAFFAEDMALQRMKEFNGFLHENFTYFEFDHQDLVVAENSFPYKDEFRSDYGSDYYGENDALGIPLLSLQIGEETYNALKLNDEISIGNGFTHASYRYNIPVPVILGAEYQDCVSIGNRITVSYLQKN